MLPILHYTHCQLQQLVPSLAKHCRQSMFFSVANSCVKTPDNVLIWQLFLFFFVIYGQLSFGGKWLVGAVTEK